MTTLEASFTSVTTVIMFIVQATHLPSVELSIYNRKIVNSYGVPTIAALAVIYVSQCLSLEIRPFFDQIIERSLNICQAQLSLRYLRYIQLVP